MAKDDPSDDGGTNEPDGIDPILEKMPPRGKRKKGGKVDGKKPKERLDKRSRGGRWIQEAHLKKGAFTSQANRAGKTVHQFAEEHKHDSGKTGKRARLALTFQEMAHKK